MGATRYFKADKQLSAKINAAMERGQKVMRQGNALAKSIGAEQSMFSDGRTHMELCGFVFKSPPDRKLWAKHKRFGSYHPRRLKANKDLLEKMKPIQSDVGGELCALLGFDPMDYWLKGRPGVQVVKGVAYIALPHSLGRTLKGAKRITDVEYEAACGPDDDS